MSEVLDWGAAISLSIGGVDRTADLIGAGEVDRELDAAGLAVVRLARGSAKPAKGAAVVLGGIVATEYVGTVAGVRYDPAGQWWVVSCRDELQEQFFPLSSAAQVLALLPEGAIWHADLHGAWRGGWAAAQDALGTVPYSIYMEVGALQSVAWAGTGYSTTIAHASGGIYDGSVELIEADVLTQIASLTATVQIGYSRRHHWSLACGWAVLQPPIDSTSEGPPYAGGAWHFGAWLREPFSLPTREIITAAVRSNPWALRAVAPGAALSAGPGGLGITFTGLPPSGIVVADAFVPMNMAFTLRGCNPDLIWRNQSEEPGADANEAACIAAGWTMGRNWTQSIVESYTLTVSSTPGTEGATVIDDPTSHDAPHDDAAWDAASEVIDVPAGLTPVVSGPHWYVDVVQEADRAAVVRGTLATLATRLRRSQRQTVLRVSVEPGAEPDLGARVRVTAEDLDAVGQVVALHTTWDGTTGAAGCLVSVAVSSGSTAADALVSPAVPDVSPGAAGYSLVGQIAYGTHIGGHEDSVPQDDPPSGGWIGGAPGEVPWDGWVGNMITTSGSNTWGIVDVQFPRPGAPVYNEGFTVHTPDVPTAARETQTGAVIAGYVIDPLAGAVSLL